MLSTLPKDDSRFRWTRHAKNKMLFYGISAGRVKRVLAKPKRTELGVAPETNAAMQGGTSKNRAEEVWVMYQVARRVPQGTKRKLARATPVLIISTWRYPGVSKPGAPVPIPDDIASELGGMIALE